jgi:hypothetical protein
VHVVRHLSIVFVFVLAMTASLAYAAAPSDARQFVVGLYGRYRNSDVDYLGRDAHLVFSTKLLSLIRKDHARTPKGYAATLDWDPICSCQDPERLRLTAADIRPVSSAGARADVTLSFVDGEKQTLGLDLTKHDGAWRISDIHTKDAASLVALLQRQLR